MCISLYTEYSYGDVIKPHIDEARKNTSARILVTVTILLISVTCIGTSKNFFKLLIFLSSFNAIITVFLLNKAWFKYSLY